MFENSSRRTLLKNTLVISVGLVANVFNSHPAQATPKTAMAAIRKLVGDKPLKPGKVHLDITSISENGASVPVGVLVDSAMTKDDFVRAIHLFTEENPRPEVVSFYFSDQSGKAEIVTRIRLATTQKVIAVAEMNNGSVFMDTQMVKVTIGGCGG